LSYIYVSIPLLLDVFTYVIKVATIRANNLTILNGIRTSPSRAVLTLRSSTNNPLLVIVLLVILKTLHKSLKAVTGLEGR